MPSGVQSNQISVSSLAFSLSHFAGHDRAKKQVPVEFDQIDLITWEKSQRHGWYNINFYLEKENENVRQIIQLKSRRGRENDERVDKVNEKSRCAKRRSQYYSGIWSNYIHLFQSRTDFPPAKSQSVNHSLLWSSLFSSVQLLSSNMAWARTMLCSFPAVN